MPGIRLLHFMRAAMDASVVLTDRYASNRSSLRRRVAFNPRPPAPQWWFISQPWGQRNAYEPQKGIEVDALGALSAAHIGINMVKPG
jgi:hypothetical protein